MPRPATAIVRPTRHRSPAGGVALGGQHLLPIEDVLPQRNDIERRVVSTSKEPKAAALFGGGDIGIAEIEPQPSRIAQVQAPGARRGSIKINQRHRRTGDVR